MNEIMSLETYFDGKSKTVAKKTGLFGDGEEHRFTDHMIKVGAITRQQAVAALHEQKVTGDKIGQILVRSSLITSARLTELLEEANPDRLAFETVSAARVPAELLDQHNITICSETETHVYASTMDDEKVAQGIVEMYYPDRIVRFVDFASETVDGFRARMYKSGTGIKTGDKIRPEHVADRLLFQGLQRKASDIHILPRPHSYTVLMRLLGVREIVYEGPLDEYRQMVTQLKDRAGADMSDTRKPQDGKFQVEYAGKPIDIRLAAVPSVSGEVVVLRLLDPDRVRPALTTLGISRVDQWKKGIGRKNGICLVCGETGSGKTTTLNASIREINRFERAIFSVEDPVEYQIGYVAQVNVNKAVDLTFANAGRAFMRANPDVIVLGEIRDEETAREAIKMSETGHLVLATLHTSSIMTAFSRMRDIGIEYEQMRESIRCIMVQSLIRTVCPICHGATHVNGIECKSCSETGYGGQTLVSECQYFETPAKVEHIIRRLKGGETFRPEWPEILDDAILKLDEGITNERELTRVFGAAIESRLDKRRADMLELQAIEVAEARIEAAIEHDLGESVAAAAIVATDHGPDDARRPGSGSAVDAPERPHDPERPHEAKADEGWAVNEPTVIGGQD